MAYASPADLLDRYDVRSVAQYATDAGVPLTPGGVLSNPRVLRSLSDASGRVDAACLKGRRYTRAVLDALASDPDPQKGALLKQTVCALAMAALVSNRVAGVDAVEEVVFGYKQALETVESLRNGDMVFDVPDNLTATLPVTTGPSVVDPNRPTTWNPMFGRWDRRIY